MPPIQLPEIAYLGIARRCKGDALPAYSYLELVHNGLTPEELVGLEDMGEVLIVAPRPTRLERLAKKGLAVDWDGLEEAIVGIAGQCVVYDRARAIDRVANNLAFSTTGNFAEAYFEDRIFPIWFGDHTPYFLSK